MSVPLIKVLRLFWDVLRSEGVGPVGGVEEVLLQVFLSLCTDSAAGAWTQPDRQTQSRESPWDGSEFIVRSKVSVSTRSSHSSAPRPLRRGAEEWNREQGTEQQLSKSTQLHWTSGYVLSEFRCSAVRCSWFCWCSSPLNIHQLFGSLVKLQSAAPSPWDENQNQNQNQHAAQSLSSFSGDASADSSHSHCVCKLDQHRLGSFYQPLDLFKNRWWRLECYP